MLAIANCLVTAAHAQSASPAGSGRSPNAPTVLPPTTVIGTNVSQSLTSPSADKAAGQKREIPGGFTIKTADEMKKGRSSNFLDLLSGVPGLFMQSENGVEISKVSIRGSGIESDDEPLGVEFLLDGISFDQGDGETIIEDFDVNTLKYAEVYRGATAFKYGSLTMGGAINLVPFTGYDAPAYQLQLEGGSYGFVRGEASAANEEVGGVHEGPTEVPDPHDHDVVLQVVAEGLTDALVQHPHVVPRAARAERTQSREIASHRGRRDAGEFTDLLGVDALLAAAFESLRDALVDRQAGDRGLGELPTSKSRRGHGPTLLSLSPAHLSTAFGARGHGLEERGSHRTTLEHAQSRRGRPPR